MTNVDVTDVINTGGGSPLDFIFGGSPTVTVGAGQTVISDIITTTATAGQHTNMATVTGTVSDGTNSTTVNDHDLANYFGANPLINLDKQTIAILNRS